MSLAVALADIAPMSRVKTQAAVRRLRLHLPQILRQITRSPLAGGAHLLLLELMRKAQTGPILFLPRSLALQAVGVVA